MMKIEQEPDHLDSRAAVVLFVIAVIGILLGALLTLGIRAFMSRPSSAEDLGIGRRPRLHRAELSEQQAWLFDRRGPAVEPRQRSGALSEYAWVDKERGLVRIPIVRAKALYVERAAADGAGRGGVR